MKRLALAAVAALAAGPALAADKAPAPDCKGLAKTKSDLNDGKTHFKVLTPGQFHFVEGIYVGSPITPDGFPPGDGALLVTHDGVKSGILIWTMGSLACAPVPVNEKLIKMITQIKTGALDVDGDEL